MLRSVIFLLSILAFSAPASFGQAAGGAVSGVPGLMPAILPNYDALKQALGLTDAQVQQLQQLQKDRNTANQAVYQQIGAKQKQLTEALNAGTADAFSVGQLELDMARLRRQTTVNPSTRDQAMAVLDEAQKAKLATLEHALELQRAVNEAVGLGLLTYPQQVQPAPLAVPAARSAASK